MRTNEKIQTDLSASLKMNHEQADTMTAKQARDLSGKIRQLQKEQSDAIAEGARVCPNCKNAPIGMVRRVIPEGTNLPAGTTYEVGCPVCRPVAINGGKQRRSYSAWGSSPQEAVQNWNAGKLLEQDVM